MVNRIFPLLPIVLAFFTGCNLVTRTADTSGFRDVAAEHTQMISVERDFSLVLSMHVVYVDEKVARAFVDDYAKLYMLSSGDKKKMLGQQTAENKQWYRFFLVVYTAPGPYEPLDSPDSPWKMYLESGGLTESPVSVTDMESKRAMFKMFFPDINSWEMMYMVRFKKNKAERSGGLKFIVTGILGEGKAVF